MCTDAVVIKLNQTYAPTCGSQFYAKLGLSPFIPFHAYFQVVQIGML